MKARRSSSKCWIPFWFEAKVKASWAALCHEKVGMLLMEHLRNTRPNLTFLRTRLVLFRSDFYTLVLSRSNFYTLGPFMLAAIGDCQELSSWKKMVEYDDDERAKTSMVLNQQDIPVDDCLVRIPPLSLYRHQWSNGQISSSSRRVRWLGWKASINWRFQNF